MHVQNGSSVSSHVAVPWPATVAGTAAFATVGAAMVVAGGIVAAINSPAPFVHGSWLAAYLVLIAGVAQIGLGAGRAALPLVARGPRAARAELWLWNAGNAGVVAGVFLDAPAVVVAGSVALLAALASFAAGTRGAGSPGVAVYRLAIVVLTTSVFIGCALAGAAPA